MVRYKIQYVTIEGALKGALITAASISAVMALFNKVKDSYRIVSINRF